MSDQLRDASDALERILARELQKPIPLDLAGRTRTMELVRAVAARRDHRSTRRGSRARSGWGSSLAGAALAAGLAGVVILGALHPSRHLDHSSRASSAAPTLSDSVAAVLRDTVRLVRFMLIAPSAARVAVAGDFNGWQPAVTPLAPAGSGGVWTGAIALHPGRYRYAFVVDDTQWIADPSAPRIATERGRIGSLLTVGGAPN